MYKRQWIKFELFFFVIGLVLSSFSSYLFQKVLHLPFTFPELIYFPFLLVYYKKFGLRMQRKFNFGVLGIVWLLLIVIAFIYGRWGPVAILSTARGFLWLFVFFAIGRAILVNDALINALLTTSVGSIVGWCICSYFSFQEILLGTNEIGVNYGNMVAVAMSFPLVIFYKKKNYLLFFVILLNIFLVLTTGLRRQISVTVLSLAFSYILLVWKSLDYKKLSILFILIATVIFALPIVEEQLEEVNPLLHRRIFEKTELLLSGEETRADETREAGLTVIFDKFDELLIPHGFVSLQTMKDKGVGIFIDTPTYMLSFTFSIWIFFLYIILFLKALLVRFKDYVKGNRDGGLAFVTGVCVLFLHFVDGTMFTYSYSSPLTGLMLGLLFRPRQKKLCNKCKTSKCL